MQVLVADDELTSRVMVETALRERGHTVRNSDDGFDAAKILSNPYAPRIAIISNTLIRLRGLDVCRFLCATGKKTGVYVILLTDVIDMELVELCRRAGVDDIIPRNISAAGLHYRLDVAVRVVELENEIRRIQSVLQGLASFESPLDKKAKVLRDANAALLESAKKKSEQSAVPGAEKKPTADQNVSKAYRGIQVASDKAQKADDEGGVRNLLSPEPEFTPKSKETNYDAILYGPTPERPAKAQAAKAAEQAMTPDDIAKAVQQAAQAAPPTVHEESHQTVLAGAEQLQNEELASEELVHPFEFDDIILKVFSGMGVTLKTELPPKALPEGPVFIAWVGVLIPGNPSWLDVLLVSGEAGAKAVTSELLGQSKVADSDVIEMFAELQNMVQGSLRRYLEENGHKSVLQLSIPRAIKCEKLPDIPTEAQPIIESGFSIGGEAIGVKLFEHRDYELCESVQNLRCYDLICDAVQKVGSESNLLIPGTLVRTKEKGIAEGVTGGVKPYRILHVSPILQALGAKQMLDLPGGNCQ